MKTTKEQFDLFKEEIAFWVNVFSLKSWEIFAIHEESDEFRACTDWKLNGRIAKFYLNSADIEEDMSDVEVMKFAFHEVCELRYQKIRDCLEAFYAPHMVDDMIHELIRVEENTVFPIIRGDELAKKKKKQPKPKEVKKGGSKRR